MNRISIPRLAVWIGTLLSLPAAMVLGNLAGEGRIRELAALAGGAVVLLLFFGVPQWLWILAVGSTFVPGSLPFLPLPFKPAEMFVMLALCSYIFYDLVFKKRWLQIGPRPDGYFVLALLFILLMHGIDDRFAMRSFGSSIWGGRSYISLMIAFLAYFVLQSSTLNAKTFQSLPTVVLLFGFVDFFANALTFALPSLAPTISGIYSNVSFDSGVLFSRRLGFAGNFGYLLLLWSLSTCRMQDFLLRGRFFHACVFSLGVIFCLASGYRSTLILMTIIVGLAAFRDFGWGATFLLLPAGAIIAALLALHVAGVQLPNTIQRGLVMIPGADWDEHARYDAIGSNEFRAEVWDLWLRTEFPKQPIFGRGFGLNYDDMIATLPFLQDESSGYAATAQMLSKYTRNEAFVVSGNIHNGLYSVVDRFGLLGCLFFLLWTAVVMRRLYGQLIAARNYPLNPPLQWLSIYIMAFTIGYPLGALKVENFLPNQLIFTGLFLALLSAKQSSDTRSLSTKASSTAMVGAFKDPALAQ